MKKYFKVTVNFVGEPESRFFDNLDLALDMYNSCERAEIEVYEGYLSSEEEEYLLASSINESWLLEDEKCLKYVGFLNF